jgi:tRNA-specific 2-thiouridylase
VDSQEICFVPGNDYKAFLRSHLGEREFHPGRIRDKWGTDLGPHDGIELFTIGQRKGLPGGSAAPRYVIDIDPETASVIVGDAEDLVVDEFEMDNAIWHTPEADEPFEATVKIRYAHPGAEGGGRTVAERAGSGSLPCAAKIDHSRPGGGMLSRR